MKAMTRVSLVVVLAACAGPQAGAPAGRAYEAGRDDLVRGITRALEARASTRVALLPLTAEGEAAQAVGDLLLEDLATALAQAPGITLVERERLRQIIQEVALQQTGLVNEADEVNLGKLAGAQVLIAVRATLLGDTVNVTARLMEIESGTALAGVTLGVAKDQRLEAMLADRRARLNLRTSPEVVDALAKIRGGDLATADAVFEPFSRAQGERRSVGLMGQAAVAAARGDAAKALELCELSRRESPAMSYCAVLEGKIGYERGELEAAKKPLLSALADEHGLVAWQRSQAANLLGSISVGEKKPEVALGFYKKAIDLDATNVEALGNQARLLEDGGDLQTAIALYQRGVKLDPSDKVLALLLRDAELRLSLAQDQARQAKITELAQALVAGRTAAPGDGWTRAKVTISLLPWSEKGAPAKRLGETAFLEGNLRARIGEAAGVELVDRELLNKVLQELHMNATALTDSATALKVGNILAARGLVDGAVVRMEGETQVTIKVIETETTRVLATVSAVFAADSKSTEVARDLADRLGKKLREVFPVRGLVLRQEGNRAEINVGASAGLAVGELVTVLGAKDGAMVAKAALVEVGPDSAWLDVGKVRVPKGARIERR